MLLQEEFSRLIYLYQQAAEGKLASVDEVFEKSLEFVEHLKEMIKNGDAEDRKAAIRMMNELYSHMKNHTKTICNKTGQTEEQLMASSENPANFSPEQWQKMQAAKQQLGKSGQELVRLVQEVEPKKEVPPSGPASVRPPESPKKKIPKGLNPKKSDWKRS
ncbi:MAG: hypothetical protein JSS60_08320 [Verrucomicrobia bacterium]|nr:hypothetical protein [Verrucomicrobiota bacterium]